MHSPSQLLSLVNEGLARLCAPREPRGLYDPVSYVLSLGGKRIRPVLMLMAYDLYKDTPEDILLPALGLETYHNYTLLHDDLMDRAPVRRGQATVHKKWNDNTAILSGDSMLVLAYQRMAACPATHLPAVMDVFTRTALEIGEGQQYDMEFETRLDVTEEEYIEMIRLKTSVLLACALKTGAILADAPTEDADKLYRFGELIGLAFQLQDDYLDVYGDAAIFGKKIGGDILCNKKTYMLINALRLARDEQAATLQHWLTATDCDPEEKIAAVTALYNELDIPTLAQTRINDYYLQARDVLHTTSLTADRQAVLWDYAQQLLGRQS